MKRNEVISEMKEIISYFQVQLSVKQDEGTLEDGELAAFMKRFEALHIGISALKNPNSSEPQCIKLDKDLKIGNATFKARSHIYKCECGSFIGYHDQFCRDCGREQEWPEVKI